MNILVIGGGIAGVSTAITLQRSLKKSHPSARISIIDPKPYTPVRWAALRALFSDAIRTAHMFPFSSFLTKNGISHIQATVVSLSPSEVVLDNDQTLAFDVCLVASGATNSFSILDAPPSELEERSKELADRGRDLLCKSSILIVGGGAIGAELAGDICGYASRDYIPKVTLVHSGPRLVPEMGEAASLKLKMQLETHGVRVVLSDRAIEEDGIWKLEKAGEEIEAEEVVVCTGLSSCSEFAAESLGDALDENGWFKVDDKFRVDGGEGRVFAVGDCTNCLDKKTGAYAIANKDVVAHNMALTVAALSSGTELATIEPKMKGKVNGPPIYLVTSGPTSGVTSTPIGAVTFGLPWVKNRTMFIFRAKQVMGL